MDHLALAYTVDIKRHIQNVNLHHLSVGRHTYTVIYTQAKHIYFFCINSPILTVHISFYHVDKFVSY